MSAKMSTGLVNHLMAGGSFKNAFEGAASELRFYSGTPPATADSALAGNTLIATVKNNGAAVTFGTAATGGVLAKNSTETWNATALAGGTITFMRLVNATDDGSSSATFKRVQNTVGLGGTDIVVGNNTLATGDPFTVDFYTEAFVPS